MHSLQLLRKPTGPVTPELSFDMFYSLLIKIVIFKKNPTDCNTNSFWIVRVHDGLKTSPANAYCLLGLLGTIDFSKIVDIDKFLVKNSKKNSAFLIINE